MNLGHWVKALEDNIDYVNVFLNGLVHTFTRLNGTYFVRNQSVIQSRRGFASVSNNLLGEEIGYVDPSTGQIMYQSSKDKWPVPPSLVEKKVTIVDEDTFHALAVLRNAMTRDWRLVIHKRLVTKASADDDGQMNDETVVSLARTKNTSINNNSTTSDASFTSSSDSPSEVKHVRGLCAPWVLFKDVSHNSVIHPTIGPSNRKHTMGDHVSSIVMYIVHSLRSIILTYKNASAHTQDSIPEYKDLESTTEESKIRDNLRNIVESIYDYSSYVLSCKRSKNGNVEEYSPVVAEKASLFKSTL
jgi:hypothetical protein